MKSVMGFWLDESSWLACRLKKAAKAVLPDSVQSWIKQKYYPLIVGRQTEESVRTEAILRRIIRPGDVAIDVGACIGSMALIMARIAGEKGKVIAFEPMPQNFVLLRNNVRDVGVEVYNFALSDRPGEATMEVPRFSSIGESFYDSRVTESAQPGLRAQNVKLRTLDSFGFAPQFIKIDVEGHEIRALQGAAATLENHHPTLMIECGATPPDKLVAFLRPYGYEPTVPGENGAFVAYDGKPVQDLYFFHGPAGAA